MSEINGFTAVHPHMQGGWQVLTVKEYWWEEGGGLGESLVAANVQQMDMQSVFIVVLDSFNNSARERQIISSAVTL